MTDDLRYPIGKWTRVPDLDAAGRLARLEKIMALPDQLRRAVDGLSDEQLDTPYRPDGWTSRQIVHHLADSHMNAFIRCKLALTEDAPTIKPYDQQAWAETIDGRTGPVEASLHILDGVHQRWARLMADLHSRQPADFARTLHHPEQGPMTLADVLQLYAWHGEHHLVQITALRDRRRW